ncbi:MAG: hypothetical protein WBD30_05680 [Bacteroidota bacterium]
MIRQIVVVLLLALLAGTIGAVSCRERTEAVQRPEKIYSKREVVYDKETYQKLADLWKEYYEVYPSENAYANWMYAARYAGDENYEKLLEKGVKQYPVNPTLLYLKSMVGHGKRDDIEGQRLLEEASRQDPSYMDPWFGLVIHYYQQEDQERMNLALRTILEAGAIADEVMDYSYNMIACLEKDAVLVTNGDNDTYPGWVLRHVINYRPDVRIVNRSLLNTDWYAQVLMNDGVPAFISPQEHDDLREAILREIKEQKAAIPPAGPFSDPLLERLIEACKKAGRPVYFAATLMRSDVVEKYGESGRGLGLVTLVTPPAVSDRSQLKSVLEVWLKEFRTSGMDSWELRHAKKSRAGKMLMYNYPAALDSQMDRILVDARDYRLDLFHWYQDHALELVPDKHREEMNRMWCRSDDIPEIKNWCRQRNLLD